MDEWPNEIRKAIGVGPHKKVVGGASGDAVYRVFVADAGSAYLKVARGHRRTSVRREQEVLTWLSGRLGAPMVKAYCEEGDEAYLLISSVPGRTAAEPLSSWEPRAMLAELTRALREVHALPATSCPFDRSLSVVVAEAHQSADEGHVDMEDLDDERRGSSIDRLLRELDSSIPEREELAFTHGDFSLPNILLTGTRVTGIVDWDRAGVADQYQDIALLLRSFGASTATDLQRVFCEVYGIRELDLERVRFYELLDEFF